MLANKTGILSIIGNETQLKKNILASLIVWISIAGLFSLFVLKCSFNWFKNIVERQKLSGNIRPDFSFKNVHIPFEINLISLISLAILLLRDYSWNTNIVIASVFGAAFVAPLLNGLAFFHRRLKKTLSFVLFYTCFTILSPISMIICTIIGFVESVVKFSKDK